MCTNDSEFGVRVALGVLNLTKKKRSRARAREKYIERALQNRVGLRGSIGPSVGTKPKQTGE